jgi:LysM repeat protein
MKKILVFVALLFLFPAAAFAAPQAAPQAAPAELPSVDYNVQSGDNLTTIAKKHGVTVDSIRQANGMTGDRLNIGQRLHIPAYKLSIWIDKSDNTLILKGNEQILKTYSVATGKDNSHRWARSRSRTSWRTRPGSRPAP